MNLDQPHGKSSGLQGPGSGSKSSTSEAKARGANRSSKVAGKLQVLPDSSIKETQQPSADLQLPKPPPASRPAGPTVGDPSSAGTASDEDDADDEDEDAEDEQDAEVSVHSTWFLCRLKILSYRFTHK